MNRNLWHKLSTFFEHGDLTPFAVIISIAHYGPVLARHGENVLVAWLVGTTIDLIHFRTVRRLFQVRGQRRIIGHAAIAILTTLMALGYHLRFYGNDLLLAAPIPLGIAILAQHAAAKGERDHANKWRSRVMAVIAIARRAQKMAEEYQYKLDRQQSLIDRAQSQVVELQAQIKRMQESSREAQTIIMAWHSLNEEHQALAKFNADLITAEQAAQLIGVKDVRTVQARAEKLNGVHK